MMASIDGAPPTVGPPAIPSSAVFAVNAGGRVFFLKPGSSEWKEMDFLGVEFKRISAHGNLMWAIGSDHFIYVFVFAREEDIAVYEVAYENERWNPKDGFCSALLPTDRHHFSTQDGTRERRMDKIELPSLAWRWDTAWSVDEIFHGKQVKMGWTYAVDFPREYGPEKKWNSMVRRRKWIRRRKYVALNAWAQVLSSFPNPLEEPFIDIAVGGSQMPDSPEGDLSVWAVTVQGRVLFRTCVSDQNPEGKEWVHVSSPSGTDAFQISVGPTGLTWAVTWDGRALVRTSVRRGSRRGQDWLVVNPPDTDVKLNFVAVGYNVVWASDRNGRLWVRRGVKGDESGTNPEAAVGTSWVSMAGEASILSIGEGDQVVALSDGKLLYRSGVSRSDPCGKEWKEMILPQQQTLSRSESISSEGSTNSSSTFGADATDSMAATIVRDSDLEDPFPVVVPQGFASAPFDSSDEEDAVDSLDGRRKEGAKCVVWVTANGLQCSDADTKPWFDGTGGKPSADSPWRKEILKKIEERGQRESIDHPGADKYEVPAINESSSNQWSKSEACRYLDEHGKWLKARLDLLQYPRGSGDSAKSLLSCTLEEGRPRKIQILLPSVTCVHALLDPKRPTMVVHTPKATKKRRPLKVSFTSETEMEEWVAQVSDGVWESRRFPGPPCARSVWLVDERGDTFYYEPEESAPPRILETMTWRGVGGHLKRVESCPAGVTWALGHDMTLYCHTGGYGGGVWETLNSDKTHPMVDERSFYCYENQRWNPVGGFCTRFLPTDRPGWSDATGTQKRSKTSMRPPSSRWQWVTDWRIDYETEGGVDDNGWQYAIDFPASYHPRKQFTDYVRRRKWVRRCQLATTGPWTVMARSKFIDVSFQMDAPCEGPISAWAVNANGDVLFRHGVTRSTPEGTEWEEVPTNEPFCSISVGLGGRVWAVAQEGSAYVRTGVNRDDPMGSHWLHVEPPLGKSLRIVSAGCLEVWAVDHEHTLYRRMDVNPQSFPEGTCWQEVCPEIQHISVCPQDQVWAISRNVKMLNATYRGIVMMRTGMSPEHPTGKGWQLGIGVRRRQADGSDRSRGVTSASASGGLT
ncbi:unnamed protein product [Cyprideis torosa]|uniref:Uncharacterized protein n=1 Tax=Cyprideis torosa TaxID=163714 RepID=A0A7R8ZJ81_9CRUS|nr:unnamed protein product [Cyprideis torosa]CAG0888008.1 unnamed protein product [Cyprideis torosa]